MKIGVIGCGYWGPNLVRNVLATRRCDEVLCYDADLAALKKLLERFPAVTPTTAVEELMQACDAVMIATPVKSHYPLVRQTLTAGKAVFVEKPLTSSYLRAKELIDLAARLRLPLMTGHTYLYSPAVHKIASYVSEGALGEVLTVSSSRKNLGIHRSDVNVMWDLAPHDLSILLYVLGEAPVRISAIGRACTTDTIDFASLTLEFRTGIIATLKESWVAPAKTRRTEIIGTRRMITYDDTSSNQKIKLYDCYASVVPSPTALTTPAVSYYNGKTVCPMLENTEPLFEQTHAFFDWVQYKVEAENNQRIALQVVACIEAACRSLQEDGRFIKVAGSDLGLRSAVTSLASDSLALAHENP